VPAVLSACVLLLALAPVAGAETGAAAVGWGGNVHAELGAGYRDTYEESPVPVLGLENITALAAGSEFTIALLSDGTVRSWGNNTWGQLGDGTHLDTWEKDTNYVTVSGIAGAKAIAAANAHALALLENGTVEAWGNNNYGQLGDGKGGTDRATGENDTLPKVVSGLSNVIAIASGGGSNFALLSNRTLVAWGQNQNGQLGIGEAGPETCINELNISVACSTVPRPVVTAGGPLAHVAAISAGENVAYALLEDGHVMSWGDNNMGQLGRGGEPLHVNITPGEVRSASSGEPLSGVVAVSGGAFDGLALLGTGEVLGWGAVGKGELGEVERSEECRTIPCLTEARPVRGLEGTRATAISAGEGYSLVVSGGKVYSFGLGEHGELGDGRIGNSDVPQAIEGLGPVSSVVAGNANGIGKSHALALLAAGVQPPAPLVSLQAGAGSLKVTWTLGSEKYKVEYERKGQKTLLGWTTLGEQTHSFELARLEAVPYVVLVKSFGKHAMEKKRELLGTPLQSG
jgi:alpha-tubulin suppressor-like RCC1 family protein